MRIDLGGNYLNYLPAELFSKLIVKTAVLDANPWKCECLQKIHDWLFEIGADLEKSQYCDEIPICYSLNVGKNTCLETENEDVTSRYQQALQSLSSMGTEFCARLQ